MADDTLADVERGLRQAEAYFDAGMAGAAEQRLRVERARLSDFMEDAEVRTDGE